MVGGDGPGQMSWPRAPPTRSGQDAWDDPEISGSTSMHFEVNFDLENLGGFLKGLGHEEQDFGRDYIPPGVLEK